MPFSRVVPEPQRGWSEPSQSPRRGAFLGAPLPPPQSPDTAASKLCRTQGSAGAHGAAAGSARARGRRARGLSPGRALLTCQARWHGGGRQQQQRQQLRGQRRGRPRGQPEEAPAQTAAGHHSAGRGGCRRSC